jgi:hypothetical protein
MRSIEKPTLLNVEKPTLLNVDLIKRLESLFSPRGLFYSMIDAG